MSKSKQIKAFCTDCKNDFVISCFGPDFSEPIATMCTECVRAMNADYPYRIHALKCHIKPFQALRSLQKTFEWRLNDRDYQIGDLLYLKEYNPESNTFTGSVLRLFVNHIMLEGFGLPKGFCIMSVHPNRWLNVNQHFNDDPDIVPNFEDDSAMEEHLADSAASHEREGHLPDCHPLYPGDFCDC